MSAAYLRGPPVSSPPEHRHGCTGKVGYLSRADAARIARQGTPFAPYKCRCGFWHLTHWRKRDQEGRT